jgi:hypothetical protein
MASNAHTRINGYIDIFDPSQSNLDDPRMISLADSLTNEIMMGNTPDFLKFLGHMESNSRLGARVSGYNTDPSKGDIRTASGIYQFTQPTIPTTKKSAKITSGFDPSYIDAIPDDPTKWTLEQSNIMALAKLFPSVIQGKPGLADSLIRESFKTNYDKDAWEQLYSDAWHTDVDSATQKRLDKILPQY